MSIPSGRPQDDPDIPPDRPEPYQPGGPRDPWGPQDVPADSGQTRMSGFPFPSYTTRTRRGTQVTVGGCCLPIPIGCLGVSILAVAALRATRRPR